MALRNLLVRVGADLSGLQKGMKQAQSQMKNFGAKMASIMAGIGAGLALKDGIEDAIKFEAIMGTVSGTLGTSMNDFVKWQNTVGAAMGFSKLETAKMANEFSLRLKETAKDSQDLLSKTTNLMKAAAIIRSKTGMEMTEISDRMRSAMNQEADGADELGIDVRVAAVTMSKAYRDIANSAPWDELSSGMRKAVLAQYIVEQTQKNFGWEIANNTALLKGNFLAALADTRMALGQAFLPILNIVLPILTTFMRYVEKAFQIFAGFMRALFPKANLKAGESQTANILSQTDATKGLGKAIDGTAKKKAAADKKAAKGGVAGFDQLNILPNKADSGADGGGANGVGANSGGGPTLETSNSEGVIDKISKKMQAFANKVKKFFAPVGKFLKKVWEEVSEYFVAKIKDLIKFWKKYGGQFIQAMKNIWKGIKPIVTWLVKFVWESIKGLIDGVITFFKGLIKFIAGAFTGDWKTAFSGIKDMVIGAFKAVWNFFNLTLVGGLKKGLVSLVKSFTDDFAKIVTKIKAPFNKIGDWFKGIGTKMLEGMKAPFINVYTWFKDNVVKKFSEALVALKGDIANKAGSIWTSIKGKFAGAYEWFRDNVVKQPYNAFVNWKNSIANIAGEVWTSIKGKFGGAYDWFKDNVVKAPYNAFVNWKSSIVNKAGEIWTGIKGKFTGAYDWFKKNVVDKIKSAFSGFSVNIGGGFKDSAKAIINNGIRLINKMISGINSMLQSADNVLPGNVFKKIPSIPYLAKGGIIDSPTIAMVGEAGKEAVMPLENNTGWINELASKLNGMGGGGGNTGPIEVTLQLNETKLGKVAISSINKVHRKSGKILLNL